MAHHCCWKFRLVIFFSWNPTSAICIPDTSTGPVLLLYIQNRPPRCGSTARTPAYKLNCMFSLRLFAFAGRPFASQPRAVFIIIQVTTEEQQVNETGPKDSSHRPRSTTPSERFFSSIKRNHLQMTSNSLPGIPIDSLSNNATYLNRQLIYSNFFKQKIKTIYNKQFGLSLWQYLIADICSDR